MARQGDEGMAAIPRATAPGPSVAAADPPGGTSMKLGVVVDLLGSAEVGQTTYRLAATAAGRGHRVWVMSA